MDHIELDSLYPLQAELDEEIQRLHGVSYASTHEKRLLALLVEFGEFANETRCFKFWSLKGPSPKEVILDEYADGLHFFFSLGIPLECEDFQIGEIKEDLPLTEQILLVYQKIASLSESYDRAHYFSAFASYWDLLGGLGYNIEEALAAYDKKLAVNYQRQENHY